MPRPHKKSRTPSNRVLTYGDPNACPDVVRRFSAPEQETLRELVSRRDKRSRMRCLRWLREGTRPSANTKLTLELLEELVKDRRHDIRCKALLLLWNYHDHGVEQLWPVVERLAAGRSHRLRALLGAFVVRDVLADHFELIFPRIEAKIRGGDRRMLQVLAHSYTLGTARKHRQHIMALLSEFSTPEERRRRDEERKPTTGRWYIREARQFLHVAQMMVRTVREVRGDDIAEEIWRHCAHVWDRLHRFGTPREFNEQVWARVEPGKEQRMRMIRELLVGAAALGFCWPSYAGEPLRLPDDRPFVAAYYFGHWWDPWKSDDEPIRADFERLREMGVSVLGCDHEWSQAIDGDWKWLDREHRLAKEAGLQIAPWLSLKVWSDMSGEQRMGLVKEWYGVDLSLGEHQDGSPGPVQIWDDETVKAGAAYAAEYIDRYRDQALLHLQWEGEVRPVVALSVELAWTGGFDAETTAQFVEWLKERYGRLQDVNGVWGTEYARWADIEPKDTAIFDYAHLQAGEAKHPQAVEDHIEFRSQVISESLGKQAELLREKHPDVLILAELPYQFRSQHPHAEGFRIGYAANPSCARSADLLWFRCTGPISQEEAEFLAEWMAETGQPAILTYRTYSDWCNERSAEETAESADLYAGQAAKWANGFGFYSWNEMVDTHVAPSHPEDTGHRGALTPEQSERGVALMEAMVKRYLELVGQ